MREGGLLLSQVCISVVIHPDSMLDMKSECDSLESSSSVILSFLGIPTHNMYLASLRKRGEIMHSGQHFLESVRSR